MTSAKKIISKSDIYLNIDNHRQLKDAFLEKYSKCEVLCREILRKYLNEKDKNASEKIINMDLRIIKPALSNLGYIFDDRKLLTRIWGQEKKKGASSCRFLRNKITHELMERALHEVVERNAELNAYMDVFIDALMKK